MVFAGFG